MASIFILLLNLALFAYGLKLGTVNKNFIHEKKNKIINFKQITKNSIKKIFFKIDKIKIDFTKKQNIILEKTKTNYIKDRLLFKDSVMWHKPTIKIINKKIKGKVKLKGLFLDKHERVDKKFSYSVKIKGNKYKKLSSFYLHFPEKRHKLFEWYGDKMLCYFNLLNHINEFAELEINSINQGVYLIEEHTNQNFLLRNARPKGPILSFSKKEMRFDRLTEEERAHPKQWNEYFYNLEILTKSPNKHNARAKQLLNGYIRGDLNPEEVFNFEKTATLFAMSEIVGFIHHLQYHNIKFYYNPNEDKLEPIANDFEFDQLSNRTNELMVLDKMKKNNPYVILEWSQNLLKNKNFVSLVLRKLKTISSKNFVDSFFNFIKKEESNAWLMISKFDPLYVPDLKFILEKNIKHINYILFKKPDLALWLKQEDVKSLKYRLKSYVPISPISIKSGKKEVFKFNKKALLNAKTFLNHPKTHSVDLGQLKENNRNDQLTMYYKIISDTILRKKKIEIIY